MLRLLFVLISFYSLSSLASFLSPGDLSNPHFEPLKGVSQCVQCHASDRNKACLNCHKEIEQRLIEKKGFHVRYENKLCHSCHLEHLGKNYDLMGLSRTKFDHDETDWPLKGKHSLVSCDRCHTQKRKNVLTQKSTKSTTYLGNVSQCQSCHKDPHKNKYGPACQSCHNPIGWYDFTKPTPSPKPTVIPSIVPTKAAIKPTKPLNIKKKPSPFPTKIVKRHSKPRKRIKKRPTPSPIPTIKNKISQQ